MAPVFSKKTFYMKNISNEEIQTEKLIYQEDIDPVEILKLFGDALPEENSYLYISNTIYETIISKLRQSFPITTVEKSVKRTIGMTDISEETHSFSIIGNAFVLNDRLIKLYNPWQSEINYTWNSWSDDSANMSKYKEYLGHTTRNDGIFYLEIKDFIEHFELINWVEVYPEYVNNYIDIPIRKMNLDSRQFSANISVKIKNISKEFPLYLFIDLPDKKLFQDCGILYEFISISAESSKGKLFASCNDSESTIILNQDDSYKLTITIKNPQSFEFNITITAYHHKNSSINFIEADSIRNNQCGPFGAYDKKTYSCYCQPGVTTILTIIFPTHKKS